MHIEKGGPGDGPLLDPPVAGLSCHRLDFLPQNQSALANWRAKVGEGVEEAVAWGKRKVLPPLDMFL